VTGPGKGPPSVMRVTPGDYTGLLESGDLSPRRIGPFAPPEAPLHRFPLSQTMLERARLWR